MDEKTQWLRRRDLGNQSILRNYCGTKAPLLETVRPTHANERHESSKARSFRVGILRDSGWPVSRSIYQNHFKFLSEVVDNIYYETQQKNRV